jgi:DNA-directed RNA polymerase specialized sigma subunit
MPDSKKKTPSNYYFIEGEVAPKILQLQEINKQIEEIEESDSDSREALKYLALLKKHFKELQDDVMSHASDVIKGVIFRAKFHKREKFDVCYQIAIEACLKSLQRFTPEKGTAFNYLSLTAKKAILYYLIKKNKKRTLSLDYEYMSEEKLKLSNLIKQEEKIVRNLEIENLIDTIMNLVQENKETKSLNKVADKMRDYLFYTQGKYDKKDFFKWAKADGISSNLLRRYVKFLKENRDILYENVGVY